MGNKSSSVPDIWAAAYAGNLETLKQCLLSGIHIDSKCPNGGYTPLVCASAAGHADIVRFLLYQGADINITDNLGFTPLFAATSEEKYEIVTILKSYVDSVHKMI
jgi:ankyrin repeat protein